jgi:NIMA (never in mitosis gene a)-related kinase
MFEDVSVVDKFMKSKTSIEDFKIISKLGEGSYSSVYKVVRKQDNLIYSLKKVRIIEGLSDKERENSVNEVRILASIRSNHNVIKYYEAFIDQASDGQSCPYLCIIMEYADNGDLF